MGAFAKRQSLFVEEDETIDTSKLCYLKRSALLANKKSHHISQLFIEKINRYLLFHLFPCREFRTWGRALRKGLSNCEAFMPANRITSGASYAAWLKSRGHCCAS